MSCFYVQVKKMARLKKKERHEILVRQVQDKPFLTDEELAGLFGVSIQTIRLDRMELGIPEVRERTFLSLPGIPWRTVLLSPCRWSATYLWEWQGTDTPSLCR